MASSGDLITPRLWGSPWFEKPPLLYWMTALGTWLRLTPEMSGRLPVALLSLAFLLMMFALLRREFGTPAAALSSTLLATSLGWLTYSNLALTDIPLAVFFNLAVFLALPLIGEVQDAAAPVWRWVAMGVCLGLAMLAKGLVPIALAVPFVWFLRKQWKRWPLTVLSAGVIALPWYIAMWLINGRDFLVEFLWKHHVERLYSTSLQHVQPWWYYIPVLVLALFPWTPLAALLFYPKPAWSPRRRFLATSFLFGFCLFSVALNKLPGYLLPLLPLAFTLVGGSLATIWRSTRLRWWLLPCALLIGLLPLLASILPAVLQAGRLNLHDYPQLSLTAAFYMAAPIAVVLLSRRSWTGTLLALCFVAVGFYLKITTFPVLERTVSPRSVWLRIKDTQGRICNDWIDRNWAYGLALYHGEPYPICQPNQFDYALRSVRRGMPVLVPTGKQ
jgi:hypothetical protein